jgi:formylglycine-generating enzyme required for sulfatase activity
MNGRYTLEGCLGQGGLGYVFLATDNQYRRHVALKVPRISGGDDHRIVERFKNEILALKSINHRNICRIYSHGVFRKRLFFTMPRLLTDLHQEIKARSPAPFTFDQASAIVYKVAQAMEHAHRCFGLHRDLKPSNVMFDDEGQPIVTDFNLSLPTSDPQETRLTKVWDLLGTYPYLAPEQVRQDHGAYAESTDVYSLGVVFYELLAGRLPFDLRGRTRGEINDLIDGGGFARPSMHRPGVPRSLEEICLRAMSLLPSHRYQTMKDFAIDLADAMGWPRPYSSPTISPAPPVGSGRPFVITSPTLGIELVRIPSATTLMGTEINLDERPVHAVEIRHPFWMGIYPVTRVQFLQLVSDGLHASLASDEDAAPVRGVTWMDAIAFCNQASDAEGLPRYYTLRRGNVVAGTGPGYRLPTEAEWEHACRAGSRTSYFFGDSAADLDDYAWYESNSENRPWPVGEKRANAFGLHDILGNVWEWCWDRYDRDYYGRSPLTDPTGPDRGDMRVIRGGSYHSSESHLRSGARFKFDPQLEMPFIGFRVVRNLE